MKKTNLSNFMVVAVIILICSAIPVLGSDADVISAVQTNRSVWASRITLENLSGVPEMKNRDQEPFYSLAVP